MNEKWEGVEIMKRPLLLVKISLYVSLELCSHLSFLDFYLLSRFLSTFVFLSLLDEGSPIMHGSEPFGLYFLLATFQPFSLSSWI